MSAANPQAWLGLFQKHTWAGYESSLAQELHFGLINSLIYIREIDLGIITRVSRDVTKPTITNVGACDEYDDIFIITIKGRPRCT